MANSHLPYLHERFGISIDKPEAEESFVVRAKIAIWRAAKSFMHPHHWWMVIDEIALEVGRSDILPKDDYSRYERSAFRNDVSALIGDSYISAMKAIEAVHSLFRDSILLGVNHMVAKQEYNEWIQEIVSRDRGVLNVRWQDGKFWPAGAPELDEKLIQEPLQWLHRHGIDSVVLPLEKSLKHLLQGTENPEFYQDAITDAYESLEALAKLVTGRSGRDLSGSQQQLASILKLDKHYREMLGHYVQYGCQFRHGQEKARRSANREEAEMYVYLSGVFIRFAIERKEKWKSDDS